jgi:hypothetical protein
VHLHGVQEVIVKLLSTVFQSSVTNLFAKQTKITGQPIFPIQLRWIAPHGTLRLSVGAQENRQGRFLFNTIDTPGEAHSN